MKLHQSENVLYDGRVSVLRIAVPNGWLYVATTGYSDTEHCSTTFVPEDIVLEPSP